MGPIEQKRNVLKIGPFEGISIATFWAVWKLPIFEESMLPLIIPLNSHHSQGAEGPEISLSNLRFKKILFPNTKQVHVNEIILKRNACFIKFNIEMQYKYSVFIYMLTLKAG